MVPLVLLGIACAFFAGFLLVTRYEKQQGARLFAAQREVFDRRIHRLEFILTHVDFESFAREQAHILVAHMAHDIAHYSLLFVRELERPLSRLVKHLRSRHGIETASNAAPRAFVKTMSDFKRELSSARPPIPEI
jgi:hypothetical protein